MTNQQTLKQGKNECEIIGVLKENNLEIKPLLDKTTGAPYNAIMGDIVVKVNEHDEHKVKVFSRELTKAGAESKLFKEYKTVMDTYTSIADLAQMSEADREGRYPTRLKVQGEIRVNDYYLNNQMNSFPEISGKFISSDVKPETPDCATFGAEIYVSKKKHELDKDGIETGRLEIEGLLVGYNGIVSPIQYKVTQEHRVADYLDSNFQVGETIEVWGFLVNSAITVKKVKQGFGVQKEEITTTYRNEILINGGEEFALDEEKAFDSTLIQKALAEREILLAGKEEEGKSKGNKPKNKTAGFGGQRAGTPTPPEKIKTDDIPF